MGRIEWYLYGTRKEESVRDLRVIGGVWNAKIGEREGFACHRRCMEREKSSRVIEGVWNAKKGEREEFASHRRCMEREKRRARRVRES